MNIPRVDHIITIRGNRGRKISSLQNSAKIIGASKQPSSIPMTQVSKVAKIASPIFPATIPIINAMMKSTGMGPARNDNQLKVKSVMKMTTPTKIAIINSRLTTHKPPLSAC